MNYALANAAVRQARTSHTGAYPYYPASEGMYAPAKSTPGAIVKRWYATAGGFMAHTGAEPGAPPLKTPQVQPTVTPMMLGAGGAGMLLVKVLGAPWLPAIAAGALIAGTMLFTAGAIVQAAKDGSKLAKAAPGGAPPGAGPVPGGPPPRGSMPMQQGAPS